MKLHLSSIWADCLAIYFNGRIKYHHINPNGFWEFTILDNFDNILYQSKGLK